MKSKLAITSSVILIAGLAWSCGELNQSDQSDPVSDRTAEKDSRHVLDDASGEEPAVAERALPASIINAVVQIRILRPNCRNDAPMFYEENFCTGTVISDRHVVTATHCFVSECPSYKSITVSEVKIPSAPTVAMTGYNWADSSRTITAKNIDFVPGFSGATDVFAVTSSTSLPGYANSYGIQTTMDIAVVDFGPGLQSHGFPAVGLSDPGTTMGIANKPVPVGYTSASTPGAFNRIERPAISMGALFPFVVSGKAGDTQVSHTGVGEGCFGDSGGPIVLNGKVVGIASARYREFGTSGGEAHPQMYGPSDICSKVRVVTYVLMKPTLVSKLIESMANNNPREVLVNVDLWAVPQGPNAARYVRFKDSAGQTRAARFIASSINVHAVAGGTWSSIPGATSAYAGGLLNSITAANVGTRTSVWTASGLFQGYYKIEVMYPKHNSNSTCVLVRYKGTTDAGFKALPVFTKLNEQIGDADKTVSSTYKNTSTNVTPYKTSNAKSYVWLSNNSTGKANTASISVQLSDAGCASGKIVADSIRLTLMGTVK